MLPWPGGGGQGSQAPRNGSLTQRWRSTWQKCTRRILLCIRIAGLQHALMVFPLSIVLVAYDTVIPWLHKYCPSTAYMPPQNLKFLHSPYSCYN